MKEKPKNRFSGLTNEEWEREAKKPDTNPECYNTKWVTRVISILSLIAYLVIGIIIYKVYL